jgi:cytochrome c
VLALAAVQARGADQPADFGRPAPASLIAAWDIDVRPDGRGLPEGSGTPDKGRDLYASQCAACHGKTGVEGPRDKLVGGIGTLATSKPVKTIGSYWPYAPTLFDYINRAMPFTAPGTLQPDEVYSLVAFLLSENGVIPAGAVIDKNTLPAVKMPNRDGFVQLPQFRQVIRR